MPSRVVTFDHCCSFCKGFIHVICGTTDDKDVTVCPQCLKTRLGSSNEKDKEGESIGHNRGGRKKSMDESEAVAIAKQRPAPSSSAQSTHAEAKKKQTSQKKNSKKQKKDSSQEKIIGEETLKSSKEKDRKKESGSVGHSQDGGEREGANESSEVDFSRRTPTPSRSSKGKDKDKESVDHSQEDEDGREKADEASKPIIQCRRKHPCRG